MQDLIITRTFAAPVAKLWQAWTDPALIRQWWGPDNFSCPSAEMDVRVGGTSIVCMRAPASFGGLDMYNTWHHTKIVPMQELEYIINLSDKDGNKIDPAVINMPPDFPQDMRHRISFKDLGNNQTELTVTEYAWPMTKMREMSEMGMKQCLAKMAACVEAKTT